MKYVHTNIIARDWQKLSKFYQEVFHCRPVGPKRDLSGEWVDKMTGIKNAHIVGEHLAVPGYGDVPTLEIYSYNTMEDSDKGLNSTGFAHIAFEVEDVEMVLAQVLTAGGSLLGEIVSNDYGAIGTGTFVYARDPEGNILEIQNWKK